MMLCNEMLIYQSSLSLGILLTLIFLLGDEPDLRALGLLVSRRSAYQNLDFLSQHHNALDQITQTKACCPFFVIVTSSCELVA